MSTPRFDDERAARPDLPHELREGLLHRLVRPVDVEVVGIGRGDHRHVGIQPQERPVELVGLDSQSPAVAQHQIAAEILRNAPRKAEPPPVSARLSHATIVEVVVLPCVPATAITYLPSARCPSIWRTLLDAETVFAKIAVFAVILRHGRGVDDHRLLRVEKSFGDQPHVVLVVDRRALRFEFAGQVRRRAVIARDGIPPCRK